MAMLIWDTAEERIIEGGVSKGVLYPKSGSVYENGVVWNGLTNVTESPEGAEANDLYADGMKYASIRGVETFGGTIEAYTYPDEFIPCDGGASPVEGLVISGQKRKPFGLCYRTEIGNGESQDMDAGYKLHLVYGATASPSEKQYETINDSGTDGVSFSFEFNCDPVQVTGMKPTSCITINSTKVESAVMIKLEEKLYGTSSTEPTLPMPDEVIAILKNQSVTE